MFDRDKNGYISADELRHQVTTVGDKLTQEEVTDLLCVADQNGDGFIDYREVRFNPEQISLLIFNLELMCVLETFELLYLNLGQWFSKMMNLNFGVLTNILFLQFTRMMLNLGVGYDIAEDGTGSATWDQLYSA